MRTDGAPRLPVGRPQDSCHSIQRRHAGTAIALLLPVALCTSLQALAPHSSRTSRCEQLTDRGAPASRWALDRPEISTADLAALRAVVLRPRSRSRKPPGRGLRGDYSIVRPSSPSRRRASPPGPGRVVPPLSSAVTRRGRCGHRYDGTRCEILAEPPRSRRGVPPWQDEAALPGADRRACA